jgi:predicted dehydrogenase
MAAKLVLALALGASALLAPQNKLPAGRVHAASGAPEMVVKVGVIGAGRIGLVHLEALSQTQDAECVIISNPTVSKAEAAAKQFFVPEWSADSDDVINHPDVQAVWICSPSSFHAEQIIKCAAAGKDVFCEKPIATDLPETIDAIRICDKASIKLMTALQRRFDPNFARVKRSIVSGEVGEVITVKLCSRDPGPPSLRVRQGRRRHLQGHGRARLGHV